MKDGAVLPPTSLRVEMNTRPDINEAIRSRDNTEIARLQDAHPGAISARLGELDAEWDMERWLQANSSILGLTGVLLGFGVDRRFFLLPAVVYGFFLQHALQGWCPPVPVMRRLNVRTAREITRERYALKALRGDFDRLAETRSQEPGQRARSVLAAIDL